MFMPEPFTQESLTDRHEHQTTLPFLNFLLSHSGFQGITPAATIVYFDLDETMFKRTGTSGSTLIGRWRQDMPQTLDDLRQRGFGTSILSSANHEYINAALEIYRQQFIADPNEAFDDSLSTRDFDKLGGKHQALTAVAELSSSQGKYAIFVDDATLHFEGDASFGFVNVPKDMQYKG